MDFVKALTYPFEDQDWLKKIGIAALVQFIPIAGVLALQGWSLEICQRVRRNDSTPLPDWSNFGGLLSKGLIVFLAMLVYQLPTLIFGCVMAFAPTLMAAGGDDENAVAALGGMVTLVIACCSCLLILYAIAASAAFFGGYMRFLDREEFGTFMQFGENIALVRNNLQDFGMALLFFIGAGLVAGLASSVTFGLAGLLASPFYSYFGGHILGQLSAKLGASAAPQV